MFEKASRLKLRFNYKGTCSVEDLWDMPLEALDYIFKVLNSQLKNEKEESLLEKRSKEEDIVDLKIKIVKHVVEVRLLEQKNRKDEVDKAARKQKLLGVISEKQDAELKNMSVEELTKIINEM